MSFWQDFHGPNAAYILDLYEQYRHDPQSVDAATRRAFEGWTPPTNGLHAPDGTITAPGVALDKVVGAVNLAQAIRLHGHLDADLDPLGSPRHGDPSLSADAHGVTDADLRALPASLVGGPCAADATDALDAIERLRRVYCATIGHEYNHIRLAEERVWLHDAAESRRYAPDNDPLDAVALLDRLSQVEAFEQFLHRLFPGKHRFSIEGLDVMVPMLDTLVCRVAEEGTARLLLGMAHRGRLNVLAHVLNKPYAQILAEFKDPAAGRYFRDDLGWTGDVKYHKGAVRPAQSASECDVEITLAPNPSHLEAVNPVVLGMARAAGTDVSQPGAPLFDPGLTLPVLIHGDAAFPGQGIVAETLNLALLPGYWAGGAIHLIANNQLGYTTTPEDARSTFYASSLAKGFQVPIVHVNADDPEACIEAIRLAAAYRLRFRKDIVIDLIGYRRYGHNEGDEPAFTQPLMYDTIREHPTVRARWAQTLVERGAVDAEQAEAPLRQHMHTLQDAYDSLVPEEDLSEPQPEIAPPGAARRVNTTVEPERLQALNEALLALPEGFAMHRKMTRARNRRREAFAGPPEDATIDWATAEELALASLLEDGVAIRFTGEDTERGTFNQRHAVFHDVETGDTYTPLENLPQARAAFEIHDSPLSENAVLGYEYGYNIQAPERLVIWEAQYGDFINSAQVIVDEFITSARAKWGQTPSLVLLLPHGYEGAGPDHSSARLERFLTLSAENNLRVANPTTPAQFFHLLRRQARLLTTDPLPLVVMTPKSLLRHPLVTSSLREIAEGHWQPVIDDPRAADRGAIKRLFLCSGKVYVDLTTSDARDAHDEVAIVRVEQLAPFPADEVTATLEAYPALEEVVWVQEEPENMGAWMVVAPHLRRLIAERWSLRYVGRAPSSSPAEGSSSWHAANQALLLKQAFDGGPDEIADDFIIS